MITITITITIMIMITVRSNKMNRMITSKRDVNEITSQGGF